jgi:putative transposase
VESLGEFYPDAMWQRCTVHFYRNVGTAVPTSKVKEVAAMLKAIHAQEDRTAARQKAEQVVAKLKQMKLANAAELVQAGIEETLFYYAFPREHWRSLRTNNPLERICAKCGEERGQWERFPMASQTTPLRKHLPALAPSDFPPH